VTVTTAFSVRGYCKMGKLLKARNPNTNSTKLTTVANTGLCMKISVKFITINRQVVD
jgi:hypothetical protein